MIFHKVKLFLNNTLINKSIKVLLLRVFGIFLFFSLTLFLTNYFDPELVGKYDFSRSLIMSVGILSVFGMHQSIVYYSGFLVSKNSIGELKRIYKKMLIITSVISALIVCASFLISNETINFVFEKNISSIVTKSFLALLFYGITMLNIDVFRAINKVYISEIFRNIFRYLAFIIAVIILYFTNNNQLLVDVFLLNFLFLALLSTCYLLFYFRKADTFKTDIRISYRAILKRSGPMAMSATAYILMQSVDVILLSKFTDFEMVAFYSVAIKLTTMISIVLASVNAVQAPKVAEFFSSGDFVKLNTIIKKSTRLIFFLTFPAIILLTLLSNFILELFGPNYIIAQNSLYILVIGQSINALCGSVGVYMNMTGKQNVFQKILLSALILNIVLNWVLIPIYGINGAAFATSFSMIFWNLITVVYIYKKDKIKTFLTLK